MSKTVFPIKMNGELSYCCTWASQCFIAKNKGFAKGLTLDDFDTDEGRLCPADEINEEAVFGDGGFADMYPDQRKDLYIVFDDGWDVPYGASLKGTTEYGSLEVDTTKFPSYTGTPAERLKKLNDAVKAKGWKGLGLWVSPQMPNENFGVKFADDPKKHEEYWRERILWCKYADIRYWKIDWGNSGSTDFRKMVTALGKELFPELIMEHAKCMVPVNGDPEKGTVYLRDTKERYKEVLDRLAFSDAFRSYDVTDDMLSATTTLDRLVSMIPYTPGVVNCEDELYIGAALGCAIGIMRSAYGKDLFRMNRRLDEVAAAVKWKRYAPSFAGGELKVSEDILSDECYFDKHDSWYNKIIGTTVVQKAPRIIARNTELPEVELCDNAPFVLASKNPMGAYSLAAVKRRQHLENTTAPKVSCSVGCAERVGVFGDFEEIVLTFDAPVKSVTAESLIRGEARTVELAKDNVVTITKDVLDSFNTVSDCSDNAVMFTFGF